MTECLEAGPFRLNKALQHPAPPNLGRCFALGGIISLCVFGRWRSLGCRGRESAPLSLPHSRPLFSSSGRRTLGWPPALLVAAAAATHSFSVAAKTSYCVSGPQLHLDVHFGPLLFGRSCISPACRHLRPLALFGAAAAEGFLI